MERLFETIRLCANSSEAELLRLQLASAGIEAHVLDQSGVLGFGGLSPKADGVRVQVLSAELERAREILKDDESAREDVK